MSAHVSLLWALVQLSSNNQISAADVPLELTDTHHAFSLDDSDRPPVANGGQDRVVQPQDVVSLNGMQSKDDKGIVSYQWQMLTAYPYAIIEVMQRIAPDLHTPHLVKWKIPFGNCVFCSPLCRKQPLRTRSWCQI